MVIMNIIQSGANIVVKHRNNFHSGSGLVIIDEIIINADLQDNKIFFKADQEYKTDEISIEYLKNSTIYRYKVILNP